MYTPDDRKPMTVPALAEARRGGHKLAMLTAYDAGFARVFDDNGVDLLLVGDSLGMVVQGHDSTLPVTVDDITYKSEEHTSELQSLIRISYAAFCLKQKIIRHTQSNNHTSNT